MILAAASDAAGHQAEEILDEVMGRGMKKALVDSPADDRPDGGGSRGEGRKRSPTDALRHFEPASTWTEICADGTAARIRPI